MDEFTQLVYNMRKMQKHYFQHRDPLSLSAAKNYEKQVDAELAKRGKPVDKVDQSQQSLNFG